MTADERDHTAAVLAAQPDAAARSRANNMIRRYGIVADIFAAMLEIQGRRCRIADCGSTQPGGQHDQWALDHGHGTGAVRGLVCDACNRGLGMLGDDPEVLAAARARRPSWGTCRCSLTDPCDGPVDRRSCALMLPAQPCRAPSARRAPALACAGRLAFPPHQPQRFRGGLSGRRRHGRHP